MVMAVHADHTELNFQYMRVQGQLETLLDFLLRRFRYLDREEWVDNIQEGRLLVDHHTAHPLQILRNGQQIIYLRPDFLEPAVDTAFAVLYEDADLIALNKPGDLPTSPSGKYFKNTLVHLVKKRFGWKKLYTLHRLDRETSGVILFAKKQEVAQLMAEQFRQGQIRKKYSAWLTPTLLQEEVFVAMPIGPDPQSAIRIRQWVTPGGKPSQTFFKQIATRHGYSQVEVYPLTGRTHQIRVHAAFIGHPVVGDKLYGLPHDGFIQWIAQGDTYLKSQNFPTHRQLLHAAEIRFSHPVTQAEMVIAAHEHFLPQHLAV